MVLNKHRKILNIISSIRNSHSKMEDIFLKGSCLNLYLILRNIFPEAVPYYNSDHIITKIDDRFYDIKGTVLDNKNYIPYKNYGKEMFKKSFKNLYKEQFKF